MAVLWSVCKKKEKKEYTQDGVHNTDIYENKN